jgi:hypothetical protein
LVTLPPNIGLALALLVVVALLSNLSRRYIHHVLLRVTHQRGDYPGDGKPKPVAFPDPSNAAVRGARLALLPLPGLIELKLASGMTAPHRLRDLADVIELIRAAQLPAELGHQLNPFVRAKYAELWLAAQGLDPDSSS